MPKRFQPFVPSHFELANFIVGTVVLTFELTAARIIAPYIGTSIYIWTSVIGVILAALAVGYAWGGQISDRNHDVRDVVRLLIFAAILLFAVNIIKGPSLNLLTDNSLALQWQALLSSLVLFAAPTIVLGSVSPYLARLSIRTVATSGRSVSRINAWGTAGSLFGTFATGYFLFGFIGTNSILSLIAIVLLATSFLLMPKPILKTRSSLLIIFIFSLVVVPSSNISALVADIDTKYGRVVVRDIKMYGRPVRVLQMDSRYLQSGVYLDGDNGLAFNYARAFAAAAKLRSNAKHQLVIGGGAFTFPAYLAEQYTRSQIDTVEIDDQFEAISEKYFGYERLTNMRTINADGRQFLNRNEKKYDVIFMDAFSSIVPPFQLLSREANIAMEESLDENGLVVANIISAISGPDDKMFASTVKTYNQVFDYVQAYQVSPNNNAQVRQNIVILASNKPIELPKNPEPDTVQLFKQEVSVDLSRGIEMSDNFAPVERFTSQGL